MKKLLVFLAVATEVFAEESMKPESVYAQFHQEIMNRWYALSDMHRMILGALAIVGAIWILCRLMSCRTNSCCECSNGNCSK